MHPDVHKQLYTLEHINRIKNKLHTAHLTPDPPFLQHSAQQNTIKGVVRGFRHSCEIPTIDALF